MTDTSKRLFVTSTGLVTGLIALTLPFISGRLIVSIWKHQQSSLRWAI